MGRSPCCAKEGVNRGSWSVMEDKVLSNYISVHGEGKWRDLPQRAGLKRCGKSCRLRWLNYLRPDIKRGNISVEEEDLIIKLHKLLGNRWSLIAGRLPGRTDNEIKNYWNTYLSKKMEQAAGDHKPQNSTNKAQQKTDGSSKKNSSLGLTRPEVIPHRVIRTRAVRCTRAIIPQHLHKPHMVIKENLSPISDRNNTSDANPSSSAVQDGGDDAPNFLLDFDMNDIFISDILHSDFHQANEVRDNGDYYATDGDHQHIVSNQNMSFANEEAAPLPDESMNKIPLLEDWTANDTPLLEDWTVDDYHDQLYEAMELKSLASFFNSGEQMNG